MPRARAWRAPPRRTRARRREPPSLRRRLIPRRAESRGAPRVSRAATSPRGRLRTRPGVLARPRPGASRRPRRGLRPRRPSPNRASTRAPRRSKRCSPPPDPSPARPPQPRRPRRDAAAGSPPPRARPPCSARTRRTRGTASPRRGRASRADAEGEVTGRSARRRCFEVSALCIRLRKVAECAALRRTNALWYERRRGVLPMKRYALSNVSMCQCVNVFGGHLLS